MIQSNPYRFFAAFITIVHAIYFFTAYFISDIYTTDSIGYLAQADNIKNHYSFYAAPWREKFHPDWFTFRPPLYGLFILLCKSIYKHDFTVLFFQNLLSIFTIISLFRFLVQQNIKELNVSILLSLILLFYPSQFIHCNMIMSDILFQFIMFQAFLFSYKLIKNPTFKYAVIASLFFVIGMLTKPVSFLLGFSLALFLVVIWLRQKKLKYVLPFLLLPITYHAYCSYNKKVTGYYHYTTVTPYFVLKYMAKYTNAQIYGEAYADSVQAVIMQKADAATDFQTRYEIMNNEGKKIIKQHWPVFIWFNVKGWLMIMIDPGRFDWYKFLNINEGEFLGLYHLINTEGFFKGIVSFLKIAPLGLLFVLAVSFVFNVVLFSAFIYFLLFTKTDLYLKLLIFLFVCYMVGATGVLGLARYRIGFAPLLWIAAAFSFEKIKFKVHVQ
ncbi:MAG: glycosyltransferase family 39 protein [Bacteroidia bacterium]